MSGARAGGPGMRPGRGVLHGAAALLVLLAAWQGCVSLFELPRYILPGPGLVAATLWEQRVLIGSEALVTLGEVLLGLVLGTGAGVLAGLCMMLSPVAGALLRPVLLTTQAIPVFALAPILTLWLGYGIWSKVAMAMLIIFFPVASSFYDGLRSCPPAFLEQARLMGAGRWRQLWLLRVPAALPALASGLRLAAVYAPIGAVIGEWVGASRGLGYLMLLANGRARIDLMFAALVVLAVMTLVLHAVADRLARRLSRHAGVDGA